MAKAPKTPKSSGSGTGSQPAKSPAGPKKARASRGKSGKPTPPPLETAAGTPMPRGFSDAAQAGFMAEHDAGAHSTTPSTGGPAGGPAGGDRAPTSTLPALRQSGPRPVASAASTTAYLEALLAKPQERSDAARQILLQQPLMASHPIVAGSAADFTPHRPPRPEKSEGGISFSLSSEYSPKGDQPTAIKDLVNGVNAHEHNQVLLGVTGSGKTFTMANIIAETQRPALILAPNKTLAAQLYGEFKSFFPDNAVEYFVSYYDYYQPEAYVPRTDTYIEKESSINEQIDRLRHAAT